MNNIKSTMSSQGWQEIEAILGGHITALRLPKNVSKKKSYQDIAIETLGKAYAVRVWERTLKDLNKFANEIPRRKNLPMI